MTFRSTISRRRFLRTSAMASAAAVVSGSGRFSLRPRLFASDSALSPPLDEFSYGDVTLDSPLHDQQLRQTHTVLMGLSDDALLKPFRLMVGQPAPGEDIGGWYRYDPNYED